MAYTKTNWVDKVTPLSAANMNKIENGISELSETKQNNIYIAIYSEHFTAYAQQQRNIPITAANLGINNFPASPFFCSIHQSFVDAICNNVSIAYSMSNNVITASNQTVVNLALYNSTDTPTDIALTIEVFYTK